MVKKIPVIPLGWGAALLIALLPVLAIVVLITGREIDRQALFIKLDSVPGLIDGNTIRSAYADGFLCLVQALGGETVAQREALVQRVAGLDDAARAASDHYATTIHVDPRQDQANLLALVKARDDFLRVRAQFVNLLSRGPTEEAQKYLLRQLTPSFDTLMGACDELVGYNTRTGTVISTGMMASIARLRWVVIAVIALAVFSGISVSANLVSRRRAEQALRESERKFSAAFEFSPHAMSITRRADGRIIAANRAFHLLFGLAGQDALGKTPLELGVWLSEAERQEKKCEMERNGRLSNLVREISLPGGRKRTVLLSVEPIVVANEDCYIGVAHDITERRIHEEEIERFNRLYFVLSRVNETLVRANSQVEVFHEVCRTLVEVGQFKIAWVGWLDPATRWLAPVAVAGDAHGYVADIRISADPDVPEGRGPSGVAFRENRIYVCNDFFSDPATLPWRERAVRSGIRASIALPMRRGSQTMGLLTVYAGETDYFQTREIKLLEEATGDISFALDVFADRERRREAEDALRQSEAQFRSTMVSSAVGMAIIAPDHRVIDVNPALCQLLGYTREEVLAKSLLALTHPDDRAAGPRHFRRLLTTEEESYVREKRYLHKDGHVIWAQLTVSLVRDANRQPLHFIAQVQDVTGRKRSLAQLTELTEQLGLALKIGRLGVWQHWPATQQTTWDARMYEICGIDRGVEPPTFEQFVGRIHPDDRADYRAAWQALLEPGGELRRRFRLLRAGGEYRHVEAHALMHGDATGGSPWILGVNVDLTDVVTATSDAERYRAQLVQAQKMETLGQLAGGVAHDFNNLLTGINGFVELAELSLPAGHEGIALLKHARRAADNARDLVRRILVYSRQAPAQARAPVRLSDVVRDSAPLLSTLLPSTIRLELELAANEPHVLADAGQIQQVIMNLCANARHAMDGSRGSLTISVDTCEAAEASQEAAGRKSNDRRRVRLRVSDTGCGMDGATLGRIFEPFFTTKNAGEGTGLGLSIVQSIVQEHGGTVTIESEVGRGTTFSLLFPCSEAPPPPEAGSIYPATPASRSEAVILVIDNEPTILTLLSTILSRAGYTVVACSSVGEAWRTFATDASRFNLVLTDYAMPEMNGLEFMHKAHALVPELGGVIMSGSPGQIRESRREGFRLIPKPFESAELLKVIREQLRKG